MYNIFIPRTDQPERYDQQSAFFYSRQPGVTFLLGGNGAGTTECSLAKVVDFVLHQQAPPRKDTPFWIIAGSYEQVMESCWKEKLHGHQRLPESEVDWRRIKWYREKDAWPYRVPLKPWPGRPGKNWTLEFKSYEQGREQMQARSVGGFLFVEQFPWGLLEEVLRGCREYAFLGNKLAEFTPIDPLLSEPLETMLIEDKLPPGWAVYRANTECALEAGHVTKQWFDEFFGMVSPEMRAVRMTGAFGSYEGLVYQSFNPAVHLITDDECMRGMVPGVFHRRGLDWGSGPDNAFAAVWGYKSGAGEWTIYDEYASTDQTMTTVDHLCEISDRWPWPRNNPHYGLVYADPSDPGQLRIATKLSQYAPGYDDISISPANNSVLEGIEHVRWMLKNCEATGRPRLRINKERCPNLVRCLKTYRWERGSERGLNPRDARPVPLKKDDHLPDALRYLLFSESYSTGYTATSMARQPSAGRHGVQLVRRP